MRSPPDLEDDPQQQGTHRKEGVQLQVVRKLRRGHWRVEDELDLHGLTQAQAAPMLDDFLRHCAARRMKCIRIIHGKGNGVLRNLARDRLSGRREVMAFCEAPATQGGSGAMLVLLKS
jgi:DNA-nicking Smr family endonuclease